MTIDAVHGVVHHCSADLFTHRNLLDTEAFSAYLSSRQPYVPLASSMVSGEDALTLDDSTHAAADAALIARDLGHSVTLFINGYNIVSRLPYSFSRLNAALDATACGSVHYQGEYYELATAMHKQKFRKAVKRTLLTIGEESNRQDFITSIGCLLGLENITVPPYLEPITEKTLEELISSGVDIQNHGWMHSGIDALSSIDLNHNIESGRKWLEGFGVTADLYAIPNGDGTPSIDGHSLWKAWFLLDDALPIGEILPSLFNRRTLLI